MMMCVVPFCISCVLFCFCFFLSRKINRKSILLTRKHELQHWKKPNLRGANKIFQNFNIFISSCFAWSCVATNPVKTLHSGTSANTDSMWKQLPDWKFLKLCKFFLVAIQSIVVKTCLGSTWNVTNIILIILQIWFYFSRHEDIYGKITKILKIFHPVGKILSLVDQWDGCWIDGWWIDERTMNNEGINHCYRTGNKCCVDEGWMVDG